MYKYGIVVIGYKNKEGIERVLNVLNNADYDKQKLLLIISIDRSDDESVESFANGFVWKHGEKKVITFPKRLGLRNHVMHCGDYLNIYDLDALVVFEDDMMPSYNFFYFVKASTEKYIDDTNIAGISLYTHCINFNTGERFMPVLNDGDNYFFQCPQSRGQVWFRKQWNEFRQWYQTQGELSSDCSVPTGVTSWPDTSWLKFHIKYCIDKNKYFVYPYISYSTCFGEIGEHVKVQTDNLQVSVSNLSSKSFCMVDFDESALKYDAFFENQSLYQYCNVGKEDLLVDLYCDHVETSKRYILTKRKLPYKIINSWGDRMIPHEMNLIYNISGNDIVLYEVGDEHKTVQLPKRKIKKNKFESYFDIMDKWMTMEESGHGVEDYFLSNKWHHIAIYGMGSIGKHLYHRLKNTPVQVDYFIDRNSEVIQGSISVIKPNQHLPVVDVIVVTPVLEFQNIKQGLEYSGIKNIISINSIFATMD